jgi:hypothetical protein
MLTINPDAEVFDREVGCTPHWSRTVAGQGPKSFVYPSQERSERRQGSPRVAGQHLPEVERLVGKVAASSGLTPSQWLRQWCSLEQQT